MGKVALRMQMQLLLMMRREYEGIKTHEIQAKRLAKGLDKDREWTIWSDGCEGGECVDSWSTISSL